MINDKENLTVEKIFTLASLGGLSVLEIGCGDGRITQELSGKTATLIAIDPDSEAISTAKKNISTVDFRVGSGESLDFENGSFDVVLFTLSLHHQNCHKALEEAARVVKDDGQILVIEPCVDSEVSIICNVFYDETRELKNASTAIDDCLLKVVCREVFYTKWEFADVLELYNWLFDFYQAPQSTLKKDEVNQLLGHKQQSRPVCLSDKLVIMSLSKH